MIEVWYWEMRDFLASKHLYRVEDLLDFDELQRASSFRSELDRNRYVMAHILCRMALATHLGERPGALVFRRLPGRKPRLVNASDIDFSLSTTSGLAAVAVSRGARIGLDIECWQHVRMMADVSSLILSRQERRDVETLDEAHRAVRLLRLWTLKEAFLKANGTGLAIAPNTLSFAIAPDAITCRDRNGDRHDFTFQTGSCLEAHFAIASKGYPARLARSLQFEGGPLRNLAIDADLTFRSRAYRDLPSDP